MEDYVTYEQAVELKRFGFDWECNHYYDYSHNLVEYTASYETGYSNWNHECHQDFGDYSAPTLSQAQKWLREVKGIYVEISRYGLNNFAYELKFDYDSNHRYCCQAYMTPEEALSAGIDAAFELLK